MAVAFDVASVTPGEDFGVLTVTTGTFTVGSGANRAAFLGLGFYDDITAASFTVISCAGITGAAIASASLWTSGTATGVKGFQVIAPTSGASKSATVTWTVTSASYVALEVVVMTGVHQTTPFTNVVTAAGASAASRSVTSTSGDLTLTLATDNQGGGSGTTNQTLRVEASGVNLDTGPGTGTTTHTWTYAGGSFSILGVNAASAGAADPTGTGGSAIDDRFRFRASQISSYTSTRSQHRSAWPDDAGMLDPARDAKADSRTRTV